ncbi:MAG: PstS family phosphate ABC transporter substrate-binding protein [Actinomycetota bacterium]|nr:PstS family phosphate ABC transporter substrate-binding protein [Actinomycetota bacterium]
MNRTTATLVGAALALGVAACGGDDEGGGGGGAASGGEGGQQLSGSIALDGSSTVAPLSEAAAELFNEANPGVNVNVGTSGTGGGFEAFCRGETDISNASRQIDQEETAACEEGGVEFEEVAVANDALTVVLNPENDFAECLTVEELQRIWGPENTVSNWSQVRQGFPDLEIERYGPGTDSGTFDYFTEAINGEEGVQTTQYNNVGEDDNATVTGVQGSEGGIGYFGFSFFAENEGALKAAAIENEAGECVPPSAQSAQNGSYNPLGRQLFIYPSAEALQRPEVQAFLEFYIDNNDEIAQRAGLIPLTQEQKDEATAKVESLISGGGAADGAQTEPESAP